jgi:hypothetical protein
MWAMPFLDATPKKDIQVLRQSLAVARTILQSTYYMISRKEACKDLGENYHDRRNLAQVAHRLCQRIQKLGFKVALERLTQTA